MKRIIIFDTETTDLVKNRLTALERQPEIVALWAGAYSPKGKLLETLDLYFKPVRKMTRQNMAIHGISNEEAARRPPFARHVDEVKAFLQSGDRIVAHNLTFDIDMVELELQRLQKTIAWPQGVCTMEQSMCIMGAWFSLTKLHEYLFGKDFGEAHTAIADGAALARCYFELVKRGYIIQ